MAVDELQVALARNVLEKAKVASISWRTVWKGRDAGADVGLLLVGWVLHQQELAKAMTRLIVVCKQELEPIAIALKAAALDKERDKEMIPPYYDSPDNKAWLRANHGLDPIPGDPGYTEWLQEKEAHNDTGR